MTAFRDPLHVPHATRCPSGRRGVRWRAVATLVLCAGGCSGGGDGDGATDRSRSAAAATMTAKTNARCAAVAPFYWEIGDVGGALVSGSVGSSPPGASTVMSIASASKWLFGAYAVERMGGTLDATYVPFLNFTSGYAGLAGGSCPPAGTIDDCLDGAAGMQIPANVGKFAYDGAHLQKLASVMGLGAEDNTALATEVRSRIGTDVELEYTQPQPAAGVQTSASQYALFLRKLLVGSSAPLLLASMLGSEAVCTNPATCPTAVFSPIPGSANPTESWHYGLAHWVEDDPAVGDGACSSPGRLGFYPWVDATRTIYGLLARDAPNGPTGYESALCGRSIRKAWVTGVAE